MHKKIVHRLLSTNIRIREIRLDIGAIVMKVYRNEHKQSLIDNGVNSYWKYNGAFNRYSFYKAMKKFKHHNPAEFKSRSRYNSLEDTKPLYYYGKQEISLPRKFTFILKYSRARIYGPECKPHYSPTYQDYILRYRKLRSEYYLPIYELGKYDWIWV